VLGYTRFLGYVQIGFPIFSVLSVRMTARRVLKTRCSSKSRGDALFQFSWGECRDFVILTMEILRTQISSLFGITCVVLVHVGFLASASFPRTKYFTEISCRVHVYIPERSAEFPNTKVFPNIQSLPDFLTLPRGLTSKRPRFHRKSFSYPDKIFSYLPNIGPP